MLTVLFFVLAATFLSEYLSSRCKAQGYTKWQSFCIGTSAGVGLVLLIILYEYTRMKFAELGAPDFSISRVFLFGSVGALAMGLRCAFPNLR